MPPLDQSQPLSVDSLLGPAPGNAPAPAAPQKNNATGAGYTIDDLLGPEHPPPPEPSIFERAGDAFKSFFENNQEALSNVAQSGGASPVAPLSGPIMDDYFSNLKNPTGLPARILSAFGVGHSDNWGADHTPLPAETQEWLKSAGLFDDAKKQHEDMSKSFGEAFLRNGAAQMAQGQYIGSYLADTFGAATIGAWNQLKTDWQAAHPDFSQQPDTFWEGQRQQFNRLMASGKTVLDAFNLAMSPFAGAISAVAGKPFGQAVEKGTSLLPQGFQIPAEKAEEAFGEALYGLGAEGGVKAPVTPAARVEPIPPQVSRARELGLIGPEGAEPTPDVLADVEQRRAHEAQQAPTVPGEAPAPSENEVGTPTEQPIAAPTAPAPTIDSVSRQINPVLMKQRDDLQVQLQTFARWQQELKATRDQNIAQPFNDQIATEQAKLDAGATGRRAATYRRRIADLAEQRDQAVSSAGMTTDMMQVFRDQENTRGKLYDMAPELTQVAQQAADQLGVPSPSERLGAPALVPEAAPAPEAASVEQAPAAPEKAAEAQVAAPQETPAPSETPAPVPEAAAPLPASAPSPEGGGIRVVVPEAEQQPAPLLPGSIAEDVAAKSLKSGNITQEQADAQGAVVQALYESRAAAFDGQKGTAEDLYRERQPEVTISPKPYLRVKGRKGKVFGEHDDFEEEGKRVITLYGQANVSTFMHEMGHDTLTWLMHDAGDAQAPEQLKQDAQAVREWLGVEEGEGIGEKQEERFANGFERYLLEGKAPSQELLGVFQKFKAWLTSIYQKLRPYPNAISPEIRGVFDRLLTKPNPERPVIAPHEDLLGIGERHTEEAATTPPELAGKTADRIEAEADAFARQEVPEIADELGAAGPGPGERPAVAGGETPSSAPNGGWNAGQLEPAGAGGSEAVGAIGEGGGEAAAPRAPTKVVEPPATAGESFAPGIGEPDYLDKAGNFRQETINAPNDVWAAIKQSVERNNEFMDFRRGVVTDKDVFLAADAMGLTPAQVEKFGVGRAYTKEEIIAINKLMLQAVNALKESAAKASRARGALDMVKDQFGNEMPSADELEFEETRMRQQMILDTILKRESGAFAEAGRSLQAIGALKKMAGNEDAREIARLITQGDPNAPRTLFQMRREIAAINAAKTPGQAAKIANDLSKPGWGKYAIEIVRNKLISGPWTHFFYNTGIAIRALYEAAGVAPMRGLVSRVHEGITGPTGEASFEHEALSQLYGLYQGSSDGIVAAWEAFKAGQTMKLPEEELDYMTQNERRRYNALTSQGENGEPPLSHDAALEKMGIKVQPTTPFTPTKAIPGVVGSVVRLSGERGIAPMHSFWRTAQYSQAKAAEAYRTARNEGLDLGSNEFDTRVAYLRENPTSQIMDASRDFANTGTLMGSPGGFTRALEKVVNYEINFPRPIGPTAPLSFIAPFIRVVNKAADQAFLKNSFLGLATPEVRANLTGINGVRAQDDQIARLLVGTSLIGASGFLAMKGMLPPTAPETDNYAEKQFWQMVNGYEHGINVGGYSYDLSRLGVPGMQMSLAANLYHTSAMMARGDFEEAAKYLMLSTAETLKDSGILRSFGDFFKATDDESGFTHFWTNLALEIAGPPTLLSQMARRIDPYERHATGFVENFKRDTPYWSESLMPLRDIWGQPVPNPSFRAVYAQKLQTDPTTMALFELGQKTGWFPGQPSRNHSGIKLNDAEYDEYSRLAGVQAREDLEQRIGNNPAWATTSPRDQLAQAKQAFDSARKQALIQTEMDFNDPETGILARMNAKTDTALGKGADAALQQ